jgi:mono/diheme cytochrome c family protein
MTVTRWMVGAIAALALLGFMLPALAQDAAKIERGKKVYAEQKCGVCHSIGDQGNRKGPLDGVGTQLTAAVIAEWIVDPKTMTEKTKAPRKPVMRAYPKLPPEDLDALVAYMQSLKSK